MIHNSDNGMTVYNIAWDTDNDPEIFAELPQEIILPKEFSKEHYKNDTERIEAISNWLSDGYGFCHNGFEIK